MIDEALEIIRQQLDSFLRSKELRYRTSFAPTAVLYDLVGPEGKLTINAAGELQRDQIILSLINIEEEAVGKEQLPYRLRADRSIDIVNPEIRLNLYVLFTAFSDMAADQRYSNMLRLLSHVVSFFQYKHVFDRRNTPALPAQIEKLVADLLSPTFEELNHLWGALGAKYMPSVLYKIRLLTIRELRETQEASLIEEIRTEERFAR